MPTHRFLLSAAFCSIASSYALGIDPQINASWNNGVGPQPTEGQDYIVRTTAPHGTPEFPGVELVTEHLAWNIWSYDPDNTDDIGDIGVISSPYAKNFGVAIRDDSGNPGAREVKGIDLDPQGTGSESNYSSVTGGKITTLSGDLFVQADDSTPANGGSVNLEVQGDVLGDIDVGTIANGDTIKINSVVYGTTTIAAIDGQDKSNRGEVWIHENAGRVIVNGDMHGFLRVDELKDVAGSDQYNAELHVFGAVGTATGSDALIEVGQGFAGANVTIGSNKTQTYYGELRFLSDVLADVKVLSVLDGKAYLEDNSDKSNPILRDLRAHFRFVNGGTANARVYAGDLIAGHFDFSSDAADCDTSFLGEFHIQNISAGNTGIQWDNAGAFDAKVTIYQDMNGGMTQHAGHACAAEYSENGSLIVVGQVGPGGGIGAANTRFSSDFSITVYGQCKGGFELGTYLDGSNGEEGFFDGTINFLSGLADDGRVYTRNLGGSVTAKMLTGTPTTLPAMIHVIDDFGLNPNSKIKINRNGIGAGQKIIVGNMAADGTIDLNSGAIGGTLEITNADGGQIINVGNVDEGGVITLASGTGNDFGGTISVSSVSEAAGMLDDGVIETVSDASLSGSITVTGSMDGKIAIANDVTPDGSIQVESLEGIIDIGGVCNGDISVEHGTLSGSLIEIGDGVGNGANVVINSVAGPHNADGDINIGDTLMAPYPPIADDGCIVINVYETTPPPANSYGELNGDITVRGCIDNHFNICPGGGINNGSITVDTTDCCAPFPCGWSWVCGACP